jgi:hypothetical protein
MADRKLILCAPLCFLLSKFGKTHVSVLKRTLHDFYNVDEITVAKNQLHDDLEYLNLTGTLPHIAKRRDGPNRLNLEIEDIFVLLNFSDEHKAFDKLPSYVTDNVDMIPSLHIMDGDLRMLFSRLDRFESTLHGLHAYSTSMSADILSIRRSIVDHRDPSNVSVFKQVGQTGVLPNTGSYAAKASMAANVANVSANVSTTAASTVTVPPPSFNFIQFNGKSTAWGDRSQPSTPILTSDQPSAIGSAVGSAAPVNDQLLSYQMDCHPDGLSSNNGNITDEFQVVESRSARRRRLKRARHSTTEDNYFAAQVTSFDPSKKSDSGKQSNKPLLIGKRTITSAAAVVTSDDIGADGHSSIHQSRMPIAGVKPIITRKSVLCIDNVHPSVTVDDMAAFLSDMSVNFISLFEARSRRHRNDTNYQQRKAFRLCIDNSQIDRLLNENAWPADIVISHWFFKNGGNDKSNKNKNESSLRYVGVVNSDQSNRLLSDGHVTDMLQQVSVPLASETAVAADVSIHYSSGADHTDPDDTVLLNTSAITLVNSDT